MGNESRSKLRLGNEPQLQFHSHAQHPHHGTVSIYTTKALPMTFIMRLDRQPNHSRLYHHFQQVQDQESLALLTLYGFQIQRSDNCKTCPAKDETIEYWEFLNYSFSEHIKDRKRRKAPFTSHELWHLTQTVCEASLLLSKFGLIWQVHPTNLVITPQGRLKCHWSHLQSNNAHLTYFQALTQFFPDLKECGQYRQASQRQAIEFDDTNQQLAQFLSPEQKWLLTEKQRSNRLNLQKCNAYKFGLLLLFALTFKIPNQPVDHHLLKNISIQLREKGCHQMFIRVLYGTLEVDALKRWTLQEVEAKCQNYFNPNYELLISQGRREDLQQFNIEAQIKADSNKVSHRPNHGSNSMHGLHDHGMKINSHHSHRYNISSEINYDQRLLQLRQYRKNLYSIRKQL